MKQLIGAVLGLLFGIVLLVLGFVQKNKQDNYTETTAEIVQIDIEPGAGDESDTYHVFVKYTVDGMEYKEELDESRSSYRVGDTVKIKYNPKDPSDLTASGRWAMVICFIIGGIMTLGFGAYLCFGAFYIFKRN